MSNYLNGNVSIKINLGFKVDEPLYGFDIKVSLDVSDIDPKNKEHRERIA